MVLNWIQQIFENEQLQVYVKLRLQRADNEALEICIVFDTIKKVHKSVFLIFWFRFYIT